MTDEPVDDEREHTEDGQLTYEVDDAERPSEAVVLAVAAVSDTAVLDLEPLYGTVDPEHLDGTLDPERADAPGAEYVTLEYAGCEVTVTPETVLVRDADGR